MMTSMLSPEITTVDAMTERCDRCGAAAKLEVVLATGGALAFCGHHANQHGAQFLPIAVEIRIEDGFEWVGQVPVA
jgi:hypothetical protein